VVTERLGPWVGIGHGAAAVCSGKLTLHFLTLKGPRIYGLKMTNLIDRIVKNIIQIGPNFISVRNIACIDQKLNKIGQKKTLI